MVDRYFIILGMVTFVVVMASGWWLVLAPQYAQMQTTADEEYTKGLENIAERENHIDNLNSIATAYETVDHRTYRVIDRIVPPAQETSRLFEELEQFFEGSELELINISITSGGSLNLNQSSNDVVPGGEDTEFDFTALEQGEDELPVVEEVVPTDTIETVQISLNIKAPSGSYSQFKDMLREMEQFTRVLDLSTINFSAGTDSYTLILKTYQQGLTTDQ